MKTGGKAVRAALNRAREDLDELRDHVQSLRDELARIDSAPCDHDEAERRISELIDAAQATDLFRRPELFGPEPRKVSPFFARRLADDPIGAFAVLCPDRLAAVLLEGHPGDGISADARSARRDELERELETAGIAEELAIRELEAAGGGTVPRRLDADPAVILAPDAELGR